MSCPLFLCLITVCAAFGQDINGGWLGALQSPGNSTPILFLFSRTSEAGITGEVVSVTRGVVHKLETISIDQTKVRWKVPRIDGTFEGVFAGDGKSIDGVWSEPAGKQSLRLTRYEGKSFSVPSGSDIDAFVPKPPTAVRAGGRFHVMHELHVTNWGTTEAAVERLELVVDGQAALLEGKQLEMLFLSKSSRIAPGVRTAIILMLSGSDKPKTIEHRLTVKRANQPASITVNCARVSILHEVVRLSPPVRGRDWVMNGGPDVPSHHRTSLLALNGRINNAQRFAFDLSKAGDPAEESKNRRTRNTDCASYGEEVIAVADSTVVSIRDGIPDGTPHGLISPVAITAETITGNHVVLDLGEGRYALYAHLQPGLRVRSGERVVRGQFLGRIGNTGRTDAPHLHFHVADAPTLDAEGIPFVFDVFERDGRRHTDEMPLNGWRISFPQP